MRIGLFTDTFEPNMNGVANSTGILYRELRRQGHESYVICTKSGVGLAEWNEDHTILRLPGVSVKQLYGYALTTPIHLNALNEIRKLNLDVIHAQTEFGVGFFGHICARQFNIPLVSTYHTTYEDYTHYVNFLHNHTIDDQLKKAIGSLSRMYGDSCAEVIVPSVKTQDLLKNYKVRSDIHVVPTGLELYKFNPSDLTPERKHEVRSEFGYSDDQLLIIYLGRIAEEKSLSLVIDGFAKAKERGTSAKLLVVGIGPDLEKLKKETKEKNLEDIITFAGGRDRTIVPDYYRSADAFVSASLSETQGMTFIEAMASGLPLFARRDIVLDNLLVDGESGYYFKDAEDFSDQLLKFENMSLEDRKKMSDAALKYVRPFSSTVFGEKALQVYNQAIESYSKMLVIDEVNVKNDTVVLTLKGVQGGMQTQTVNITVDDYYESGLRKNGKISDAELAKFREKEKSLEAYGKALRKISYKDRTSKEIKDYLYESDEYSKTQVDWTLKRLEEKGYIDDERYTEESISKLKIALFGNEHIVRTLVQKGIPESTVREALASKPDDQYENALRLAEKTAGSIHDESVRMKKNKIQQRLMQKGYTASIASDVVAHMNFTDDEENEADSLKIHAMKAKKRYEKKYSGSELRNRVFRYCAAKGYRTESIYVVLDEMEWK